MVLATDDGHTSLRSSVHQFSFLSGRRNASKCPCVGSRQRRHIFVRLYRRGHSESAPHGGTRLGRACRLAIQPVIPGALAARWVIADTAHERFGTELDAVIVRNPERLVEKGAVALAELSGGPDEVEWVSAENVALADHGR